MYLYLLYFFHEFQIKKIQINLYQNNTYQEERGIVSSKEIGQGGERMNICCWLFSNTINTKYILNKYTYNAKINTKYNSKITLYKYENNYIH